MADFMTFDPEFVKAHPEQMINRLNALYASMEAQRKKLRDEFAMHALPGLIQCVGSGSAARYAYKLADEMLKEREK